MYIGTASWTIPKFESNAFPIGGTHLERYSKIFNAVEINSSFYKDHLSKSYEKWAGITPEDFAFSVKLHQRFTHNREPSSMMDLSASLEVVSHLKNKWKALLVQFPAEKKFNATDAYKLYKMIRKRFNGVVAIEPRNLTWLSNESIVLMNEFEITKVSANPEKCPGLNIGEEKYFRLHGSPEIYRSSYSDEFLDRLTTNLLLLQGKPWCIFNNTTFGYATTNALELVQKLGVGIDVHNFSKPEHLRAAIYQS
jgi:uncharacterized protein YecE (DUF72 family)